MRKEFENVPIEKDTTKEILNNEKPEIDSVEIRGYQTVGKPTTDDVLIKQSIESKGVSDETLQLRDIKDIQMGAYASEYTVTSDQISVGATIISVFATILITLVLAIGVVISLIYATNLKLDVCTTDKLEPNVSQNSLMVMTEVGSINDVFEQDIIQYRPATESEEDEIGMVFWYDGSEQAQELYTGGLVYIIGNMENYNQDISDNSKLNPELPEELNSAMNRYALILVSVGDIEGKLSFSIKNLGEFMYFMYDNWIYVVVGLLVLIIILFVIRYFVARAFENKLFKKIEEERKIREQCQDLLRQDLVKVQNKFADVINNEELMNVLSKSDKVVVTNPRADAKRRKIEKELEKRKREQIEELRLLAEKQKKKEEEKQNKKSSNEDNTNQTSNDTQKAKDINNENSVEKSDAKTDNSESENKDIKTSDNKDETKNENTTENK